MESFNFFPQTLERQSREISNKLSTYCVLYTVLMLRIFMQTEKQKLKKKHSRNSHSSVGR